MEHLFLLTEASKRGELWVIIARDATVKMIKGRAPLQNERERERAIKNAFPDAHVVLGDDVDFLRPVREIDPDLILLGYDQQLPPDIDWYDIVWKTERLPAFQPDIHKSSLRRQRRQ